MRPFIAILAITVALICLAMAQTFDFVPTQPCTTSNNTPASTAYVHSCAGGGGGGVTSFNSRTGVVSPQTGDYAFSNISGVATGAQLPFPSASTLGGTESGTAPSNQFMTGITTLGLPTFAQPSFTNISGTVAASQLPFPSASTLGGVLANTGGGGQFVNGINPSTGALTYGTPAGGGSPGGTNGQVQFNNSGAFGGLTNAQLTTDVNVFTATTSGAVPASGGSSTTSFLAQNGTFQTPAGGGNVSTSGTITTGNCAQWASATTILSTSSPCGSGSGGTNLGYVNIVSFGAIGDGTCHPLSGIYGSLAAAQAVYPFVSDLTQCVDWAATQQAINNAFSTAPLANGSFPVYCPVGNFQLSNTIFFDQANNSQGSYAAWASGTTYANGANVKYNGIPWVSMGSGNVGNPPTSMAGFPANFSIVNSGGSSIYPAGLPWATVQISNASPAVITPLLAGGTIAVTANQPVVFFTQQGPNPNGGATPVLPTGINANQVYYATAVTGTTFEISATPGGAAINTSSAGVGNFFVSGQVWQVAAVQNASLFSSHVSFLGAEGLGSTGGCTFTTQNDWTSPAIVIGPQNGNIVKSITVQGQVGGSPGNNGYKCTAPYSNNQNAGFQLGSAGFAVMSSGGGSSRTLFEDTAAFGFYIGDWHGYSGTGELTDSNTWIKPYFWGNCINIFMAHTQAFINTIYDGTLTNSTTNVFASDQEGVKAIGGNYSQPFGLGNIFTISGVSTSTSCANNFVICIVATIASPDNNLQMPMCAYAAGSAYRQQAKWLNAWPFASSCGYNTWVFKTSQWGLVGTYVMNYNPFTAQITLGVPQAYAGIYQGTCCGSNFASQLAAQTTVYAAEAAISFFGNNQVDSIHIENVGTPTTLSAFATEFFGGTRPAELKNVYTNSAISLGSLVCCNRVLNATFTAQGWVQNTIPWINSSLGDTVLDEMTGGYNAASAPTANFAGDMDRALIATQTATYVEGRHMTGNNNQNTSTGSGGNNSTGPLLDFSNNAIGNTFLTTPPLVNPATLGQLSGGYYADGGSAYGSGKWDNPSNFVSSAAFSVNASNQMVNLADLWRSRGWGQSRYWGVRPEPASSPCILPSQATSLASLPAITYTANLQDFLAVNSGGTGYSTNDVLTLVGGTGTVATVFVTGQTGGVISSVQVLNKGAYTGTLPTTFTVTGGTGTGATFRFPIWYVNYTIGYPLLWGGHVYHACNWNNADFGSHTTPVGVSANTLALKSTHTGWTYGQNLTTSNIPNLAWTMDGASPFIYFTRADGIPNMEALELMFPGLVFSLTGTGGCAGTQSFIVLETHVSAGYVKVVRADNDGTNYLPSLAASGTTCTGTTVGQQSFALVYPY